MKEGAIKKILQISMIVDDLEAYLRRWNDDFGIGPWILMEFNENTVDEQYIHEKPEKWGVKVAVCNSLNVQLEMIQPLYGDIDPMLFLKSHGPGIHHIAVEPTGDFPAWKEKLREMDKLHFLYGGKEAGASGVREFEFVDLQKELGAVMETYYDTGGFVPGPSTFRGYYPPREE